MGSERAQCPAGFQTVSSGGVPVAAGKSLSVENLAGVFLVQVAALLPPFIRF